MILESMNFHTGSPSCAGSRTSSVSGDFGIVVGRDCLQIHEQQVNISEYHNLVNNGVPYMHHSLYNDRGLQEMITS